ncbi:MAG: hypothetical protein AB1567_00875, partial [bacterium]
EICKVRDYKQLIWIRNQKKIKKVTKGNFEIGYFTIEMLDRRFRITRAIKGIDPEKPNQEDKQVQSWFKRHKPLKELTPEEKLVRKERMKLLLQKRG